MTRLILAAFLTVQWTPAQDGSTARNWPHYGGAYQAWRHSSLNQIHTKNVKRLAPVWVFQTGDYEGGLQATPIVIDGVMYLPTSRNRVFALDAATGSLLWQYNYPLPRSFVTFYGPWNRGVAVGHGRVFLGTLDNHVVALDQKTGRELWRTNVEDTNQCGCNITAAPLVVKDKVIVGVTGGDSAHRGYITAFDVKTGRQAWRFWTIPGPGEPGHETWEGDSWKYGGGSSWMTGSYDPQLNLVYWSVGNPAADFYGDSRKGANLYTDSIVALDADSGKLKWYCQQIPHDVWDFDTAYENILLDLTVKGQQRKLLLNVNKGGFTWVVDRATGQFVSAYPIVKHYNWIKGITETGQLVGRNEPEAGKKKLLCPSIGGGRSWNQAAYSPITKLLYTTAIEWCQEVTAMKEEPQEGKIFMGGQFENRHPPGENAYGHLDALDPLTGKALWSYKYKYPLLASILSTAGDLIFTGDAEGFFFALDARTGGKLWNFQTGSGHRGSAVTYSVNGRQFIATPSGWGSALAGLLPQLWPETEAFRGGSSVFVFALPEVAP
ncbi:MAG: PQQ-dependent dehydrogenase, methanol/ethanol family [Acidobacteria bacterium]|nr:PQQ-dependent dehydrogenase, methanol/ethanol family [Acidobacteriota bacterium]